MTSQQGVSRQRSFTNLSKTSRSSASRNAPDVHPFNNGLVETSTSSATRSRKISSGSSIVISANSRTITTSNAPEIVNNAEEEARLRSELRYYFMTPCEKWRYRRKVPVNLSIQLIKVFLVTALVILFGNYRAAHISYLSTLQTSLAHLYLYGWNPTYETPPYPPSSGPYAVYTKADFYDSVDYTSMRYNETRELETDTFKLFRRPNSSEIAPPWFCVKHYVSAETLASNRTVIVDFSSSTWCLELLPVAVFNETSNSTDWVFNIEQLLKNHNKTLLFNSVEEIQVNFAFISVKPPVTEFAYWATDCYYLNASVVYDNNAHTGQVLVRLNLRVHVTDCAESSKTDHSILSPVHYVTCGVVVLFSVLSLLLCLRSLRRGYKLMRKTASHFEIMLGQPLTFAERFEFINLWFVMVVACDILTISSCVMKLRIDMHNSVAYDLCSVLFGLATLLTWIGVLRYLAYFAGYSDLILTLRKAGPNMLRYLLCALTIFLGFLFCGWVVIGPYHFKMRTLGSTAECLFSLINGDDMYATFSNLSLDVASTYVEAFLRIYLYFFISMFIYMVLAVFLSVILDVYETVKQTGTCSLHQSQAENSDLFKFIYRLDDDDSVLRQTRGERRGSRATVINGSLNPSTYAQVEQPQRGCLLARCCCGASVDDGS